MFEEALFNYIESNFVVPNFSLNFGYGEIEEGTQAPYIIQWNLDTDGTRRTLNNKDDFTDGSAFIQWTLYCSNPLNATYLQQQLFTFINAIRTLTYDGITYQVETNQHTSSPGSKDANTDLWAVIVAQDITYHKVWKGIS